MKNTSKYTYIVSYDEQDQCFICFCLEKPEYFTFGTTFNEALDEMKYQLYRRLHPEQCVDHPGDYELSDEDRKISTPIGARNLHKQSLDKLVFNGFDNTTEINMIDDSKPPSLDLMDHLRKDNCTNVAKERLNLV